MDLYKRFREVKAKKMVRSRKKLIKCAQMFSSDFQDDFNLRKFDNIGEFRKSAFYLLFIKNKLLFYFSVAMKINIMLSQYTQKQLFIFKIFLRTILRGRS